MLNPALSAEQLYDPVKDFSSVAGLAISVAMIMVNPSVPAKNLKELVAYAKANPGKLSYGSWGAGTMSNLCGELFKKLASLPDIVHIPARAPGYTDLIAGTIPIMTSNITGTVLEMHKAGQVRILAVAADHRLSAAPDIETTTEAGYPDLVAQLFVGLFAPAGTPRPIITVLPRSRRKSSSTRIFKASCRTPVSSKSSISDPIAPPNILRKSRCAGCLF